MASAGLFRCPQIGGRFDETCSSSTKLNTSVYRTYRHYAINHNSKVVFLRSTLSSIQPSGLFIMENLSDATLSEMFAKRLAVLHQSLEKLDKLRAPLERPAGLLRLPFEIRPQIYHYCIPRKHIIDVSIPQFPYEWPTSSQIIHWIEATSWILEKIISS
jgi:hypothetical protein